MNLYERHLGLDLRKGNFVRMITCDGHCFKESVALEDMMVKSVEEDPFCVPRYEGCKKGAVNVHLPTNDSSNVSAMVVSVILGVVTLAFLGLIAYILNRLVLQNTVQQSVPSASDLGWVSL